MSDWKTKTSADHMQDFKDRSKEIDALSPLLRSVLMFLCRQPQTPINSYMTKVDRVVLPPMNPIKSGLEYVHARMVTNMLVFGDPNFLG